MTGEVRAVVVDRPGRHRVVAGPAAEPGPGEARVAVAAAGLSSGDRDLYDGTRDPEFVRYPVVPGHEWSGTVDAVGEGVPVALLGRRVVGEGLRNCLTCDRCREGAAHLCSAGYQETGYTLPGACADVLTLPARLLHPLDDHADPAAAALLEPAAAAAAAVLTGAPAAGSRIVVMGADIPGLLAVQLLAASSPAELLVAEPRAGRAERALAMGATGVLTPDEAGTGPGTADLVVVTAGAAGSAQDACLLARRGGRVVLTGVFRAGSRGIDPHLLSVNQLTVASVSGAPPAAWAHAVRAFGTGLLDPGPLITHQFPLESFGEALALVGSGRADVGKVLLRP